MATLNITDLHVTKVTQTVCVAESKEEFSNQRYTQSNIMLKLKYTIYSCLSFSKILSTKKLLYRDELYIYSYIYIYICGYILWIHHLFPECVIFLFMQWHIILNHIMKSLHGIILINLSNLSFQQNCFSTFLWYIWATLKWDIFVILKPDFSNIED